MVQNKTEPELWADGLEDQYLNHELDFIQVQLKNHVDEHFETDYPIEDSIWEVCLGLKGTDERFAPRVSRMNVQHALYKELVQQYTLLLDARKAEAEEKKKAAEAMAKAEEANNNAAD